MHRSQPHYDGGLGQSCARLAAAHPCSLPERQNAAGRLASEPSEEAAGQCRRALPARSWSSHRRAAEPTFAGGAGGRERAAPRRREMRPLGRGSLRAGEFPVARGAATTSTPRRIRPMSGPGKTIQLESSRVRDHVPSRLVQPPFASESESIAHISAGFQISRANFVDGRSSAARHARPVVGRRLESLMKM